MYYDIEINNLCKELKESLFRDDDFSKIKELVKEIIDLMEASEWDSRQRDEIELPHVELMGKGYYQEALDILRKVIEKESCNLDQGDLYVKMGVCYYYLKDKDNALKYFNRAIEDDEDYVDEARPYLKELRGY